MISDTQILVIAIITTITCAALIAEILWARSLYRREREVLKSLQAAYALTSYYIKAAEQMDLAYAQLAGYIRFVKPWKPRTAQQMHIGPRHN